MRGGLQPARPDRTPALGEPKLAEESFQRALQLNPRDGDAKHNFGWFLCQQRRYAEADAEFAGALALPQYRDVQRTLLAQGICQARAGQLAEAERRWRAATSSSRRTRRRRST